MTKSIARTLFSIAFIIGGQLSGLADEIAQEPDDHGASLGRRTVGGGLRADRLRSSASKHERKTAQDQSRSLHPMYLETILPRPAFL